VVGVLFPLTTCVKEFQKKFSKNNFRKCFFQNLYTNKKVLKTFEKNILQNFQKNSKLIFSIKKNDFFQNLFDALFAMYL